MQGMADNPKVNAIVLVKGPAADAGMSRYECQHGMFFFFEMML